MWTIWDISSETTQDIRLLGFSQKQIKTSQKIKQKRKDF